MVFKFFIFIKPKSQRLDKFYFLVCLLLSTFLDLKIIDDIYNIYNLLVCEYINISNFVRHFNS